MLDQRQGEASLPVHEGWPRVRGRALVGFSVLLLVLGGATRGASSDALTLHDVYATRDQGRYQAALEQLRQLESRVGRTTDIALCRALILGEDIGSWAQAVDVLRPAAAKDPDRYETWVYLANAYSQLGRTREALNAAANAYALAPENAWVLEQLARSYRQAGGRREAIRTWGAAARLFKLQGDGHGLVRICYTLKDLGAVDRAEAAAEAATSLDPGRPEAWLALGHVRKDRLRYRVARQAYANAVAADPSDTQARDALSRSLEVDGWAPLPVLGVALSMGFEQGPLQTEGLISEGKLASAVDDAFAPGDLVRTTLTLVGRSELTWRASRHGTVQIVGDGRRSQNAYLNSLFGFEDVRALTTGVSFEQVVPDVPGLEDCALTAQYFYARLDSPDLTTVERARHQVRWEVRLAPTESRAVLRIGGSHAVEDYREIDLGSRHWFVWGGFERRRQITLHGRYELETVRFAPGELRIDRHEATLGIWRSLDSRSIGRLGMTYARFENEDPSRSPISAGAQRLELEPAVGRRETDWLELSLRPSWRTGLSDTDFDSAGIRVSVRLEPRVPMAYRDGAVRTSVAHRAYLTVEYAWYRYYRLAASLHTFGVMIRF